MARHPNPDIDESKNLQNQRTKNAQHPDKKPKTSGSFKNDPEKSDADYDSDPQQTRQR